MPRSTRHRFPAARDGRRLRKLRRSVWHATPGQGLPISRKMVQKRTRTALRMSQNCEIFDLGYLSEAPVGAPRMYFCQRIWVPSPEKLNDFNRRLLTQNGSDFQQICMADQLQCDAFDAVASSSENGMLSETIINSATMLQPHRGGELAFAYRTRRSRFRDHSGARPQGL